MTVNRFGHVSASQLGDRWECIAFGAKAFVVREHMLFFVHPDPFRIEKMSSALIEEPKPLIEAAFVRAFSEAPFSEDAGSVSRLLHHGAECDFFFI